MKIILGHSPDYLDMLIMSHVLPRAEPSGGCFNQDTDVEKTHDNCYCSKDMQIMMCHISKLCNFET